MADSEEENDKDITSGINMTGFLFGNIDDNGQLEDDILDPEAKQHIASLNRLGLSSFIREMMQNDDITEEKENESNDKPEEKNDMIDEKDTSYVKKSPSALDFFDINELAEDEREESGKYNKNITIKRFFKLKIEFYRHI